MTSMREMTLKEAVEIRDCHPEGELECYCDNTHEQNNTVCMYCYIQKRIELNLPEGARIEPYELFPGYLVEKLPESDDICYAYKVTGPRSSYLLMRNTPNPSLLFVVSAGLRKSGNIRGCAWFTDKRGKLEPASVR